MRMGVRDFWPTPPFGRRRLNARTFGRLPFGRRALVHRHSIFTKVNIASGIELNNYCYVSVNENDECFI